MGEKKNFKKNNKNKNLITLKNGNDCSNEGANHILLLNDLISLILPIIVSFICIIIIILIELLSLLIIASPNSLEFNQPLLRKIW